MLDKNAKARVITRLLTAWQQDDSLRLGQLLSNAVSGITTLHYIEDDALCRLVEEYLEKRDSDG